MGKTLAEKILSNKSHTNARSGDIIITATDLVFSQDSTGPLTLIELNETRLDIANPGRTILFLDHCAPSPAKELSNDHVFLRNFAAANKVILSDIGAGVCHQIRWFGYKVSSHDLCHIRGDSEGR